MSSGWELANFRKNPIALFAHVGSLDRGSKHRGTTKAQAKIITDAARVILARGYAYVPPLYTKAEMRAINAKARATLTRLNKRKP
jgi:hypothetical protein